MDPRRRGVAAVAMAARRLWVRADRYIQNQLTWNRLYRVTSYLRSALWVVPFLAILLVLVVAPTLVWFDEAGQHSELLDHDRPVGEQLFLHFHRHVNSLVLKTSSLEDAYRALAIVNKAQESYAKGCRLELD